MTGERVAGVILAAGRSSRLGRPKQLLDLDGHPLLRHTLDNALASTLDPVLLVLGHHAEEVAAALGDHSARIVRNSRFAEGQASSVVAGIAALPDDIAAAMLLLGDQPGVSPEIIDTVLAAWRANRGPIAAPVYGGTIGNPILFRRDLFPDLLRLDGDRGARAIVRARSDEVLRVPVPLNSPPLDVDTEEDYAALKAWWDTTASGDINMPEIRRFDP